MNEQGYKEREPKKNHVEQLKNFFTQLGFTIKEGPNLTPDEKMKTLRKYTGLKTSSGDTPKYEGEKKLMGTDGKEHTIYVAFTPHASIMDTDINFFLDDTSARLQGNHDAKTGEIVTMYEYMELQVTGKQKYVEKEIKDILNS